MNTDDLQECISTCRACHDHCARTLNHCLEKGGAHAEESHIQRLLDCIRICETSADFMSRGSESHHITCGACAEICELCAEDCERLADDRQMAECAATCRACANICREMSGHHGHSESHADEPAIGEDAVRYLPGHDEIAALAQQLHADEGRPKGRDQEYWFRAEQILRERMTGDSGLSHAGRAEQYA